MLTDINLAIYQMKLNGYSLIEIADALHITDEQTNEINQINNENVIELRKIDHEL